MSDDKPMIYGPDGITPARADEAPPQAVIFADLVPGHIQNAGIVHDDQRQKAPQPMTVAVLLPENCIMVEPDARLAAKGESYLMKLAHRAVEIVRGRGSVRMSVPEQINHAAAMIQLFQYLTNQRVKETQLAKEFARLFEAHAEFEEKAKAEAEEREEAYKDGIREAFIAGLGCGETGDIAKYSGDDSWSKAADDYIRMSLGEPIEEPARAAEPTVAEPMTCARAAELLAKDEPVNERPIDATPKIPYTPLSESEELTPHEGYTNDCTSEDPCHKP